MKLAWFVSLVCALFFVLGSAKVSKFRFEEELPSHFYFLDNFCFDTWRTTKPGLVTWEVTRGATSVNLANMSIAFYDDEETSWPKVVGNLNSNGYSCSQNLNVSVVPGVKAELPLSSYPKSSAEVDQGRQWYWYVVLATCKREHLKLEEPLEITFTFSNPGGFFYHHFSKDQQSILEMHLFAFIPLSLVIGVILLVNVICLMRQQTFHHIIRLFAASYYIFSFSLLFSAIHYFVYAFNGNGAYWLDDIGLMFRFMSEIAFIMILLLIAGGWTISTVYIRHRTLLLVIFISLCLLYFIVFVWSQILVDRWSLQYIFETPPGIILVSLRFPLWIFFLYSTISTISKEPKIKTKKFYKIFLILFTVWFLVLPFIVILSIVLPSFARAKTILGIDTFVHFLFVSLVIAMLWYKWAPRYFEYLHDMHQSDPTEDAEKIKLFEDENRKLSSQPLYYSAKQQAEEL